jgi:hypothetical protein
MQEDYKSIWLSKISDFISRHRNSDGYHRLIRKESELFTDLEGSIKRALTKSGMEDEEIDAFIGLLSEDRSYTHARSCYQSLVSRHKELLNIEVQVRKSDLESKMRFLIFRILTAIGIAVVILGTGFVAHELEIPLPLLRLGP